MWEFWKNKIELYKNELINIKLDVDIAKKRRGEFLRYYPIVIHSSTGKHFRSNRYLNYYSELGPEYSDGRKLAIDNAEKEIKSKEAICGDKKKRWYLLGVRLKGTGIPYRLWMDNFMNDAFIRQAESNS